MASYQDEKNDRRERSPLLPKELLLAATKSQSEKNQLDFVVVKMLNCAGYGRDFVMLQHLGHLSRSSGDRVRFVFRLGRRSSSAVEHKKLVFVALLAIPAPSFD